MSMSFDLDLSPRKGPAPAAPTAAIAPEQDTRPRPKTGILDIAPYVPGKAKAQGHAHPLKLSANENVLGCSPKAQAAYAAVAGNLALYPDPRSQGLREAIGAKFGVEPDRLIFGCGSDEVFTLLAQTYLEPGDNAVQMEFGFFAYRIAIRAAQGEVRFAKQPDRRIDVDAILEKVDDRTKIVFLDNPGNPTGAWLKRADVERLHASLPARTLLVLDGAYTEFVDDPDYDDGIELASTAHNVVVSRTFSKIYGLAGLRVGWAYAPEPVISAMDRIRPPFNINLPAQSALVSALQDDAFLDQSRALVAQGRPWMEAQLEELGLDVDPGQGNFVLVRFADADTAHAVEAHLTQRGVLVRGLANYGLGDSLRITIGREAENQAVVDALSEIVSALGGR